jgi:hypothetical protein
MNQLVEQEGRKNTENSDKKYNGNFQCAHQLELVDESLV